MILYTKNDIIGYCGISNKDKWKMALKQTNSFPLEDNLFPKYSKLFLNRLMELSGYVFEKNKKVWLHKSIFR